jgi:hypothetical protein
MVPTIERAGVIELKQMVVAASQHNVILATKLLLRTVCKSDQWETESFCRPAFPDTLTNQKTGFVGRISALRLNSLTKSQPCLQLCLGIYISSNSLNLLQFLLYTEKEKGGKPDRNLTPFPMV